MRGSEGVDFSPCSCSQIRGFDANGRIIIHHEPSCLLEKGRFSAEQWNLLGGILGTRASSGLLQSDVDESIGEYIPSDIFVGDDLVQSFQKQSQQAIKDRKNTISVGFGRGALKFSVKRSVKKALKGGVKIRVNRLNLIQGRSNVSKDTPLGDVMTSFDIIVEQIVQRALRDSKDDQDHFQIIIDTEHRKSHPDDTGMSHPISSRVVSIANWKKREEKSRVLAALFSKIEPYDYITLGDNITVETVLIRKPLGMHDATTSSLSMNDDDDDSAGSDSDNGDGGGGGGRRLASGFRRFHSVDLKQGSCVVNISNKDNMCLARAVAVCIWKNDVDRVIEKGGSKAEIQKAKNKYRQVRTPDNEITMKSNQWLEAFIICLCSGVDPRLPTSEEDIKKIALELNITIKVIDKDNPQVISKFGDPQKSLECIYLLREKIYSTTDKTSPRYWKDFYYHFHAIVNIKAFKCAKFYCTACDVRYSDIMAHKCDDKKSDWCFACWDRKCVRSFNSTDALLRCSSCKEPCCNLACSIKHKSLKICKKLRCARCGVKWSRPRLPDNTYMSTEECLRLHNCTVICRGCGREKKPSAAHKCYMVREKFKPRRLKYLFIDYETDQSSGTHLPIYCYLKWVELEFDPTTNSEIIKSEGEKEFGVDFAVFKDVGDFLFTEQEGKPSFKDFTMVAHNMRGFDGCFLLRYLIEKNVHVKIIANGMKLTTVKIPSMNVRLIDSLNFLQMSLANLPETMGIENQSKGYFPHFFSCPENFKYQGPLPEPKYYGFDSREGRAAEGFFAWRGEIEAWALANNMHAFDFDRDIRLYCKQDVEILLKTCLKFRSLFLKTTKEIPPQTDKLEDEDRVRDNWKLLHELGLLNPLHDDPLEGQCNKPDEFDLTGACDPFSYSTMAGVCGATFKAKFLKKNSVAQINPSGHENQRYSNKACEYIQYLIKSRGTYISYALNTVDGQEVELLGKYRVDGFEIASNTVHEFYGCFWHGCPKCIKNMHAIHPVRKISFETLYNRTLTREDELRAAGFAVEAIWECEWECMKRDPEVREITNNIHIKSKLNPRDAFRGGRVEPGHLFYNIENSRYGLGLQYLDICSLYPSVNCFEDYPVGHPEIITSNFDKSLKPYFGLVQCAVLPPRNIRSGVLPLHAGNKLMFPLCRTCAETRQVQLCRHDVPERLLYGVWVSKELKLAIKKGYEVIEIFCVHHFSRKSKELFSEYIKTFFKIKLSASARPEGESAEDFDRFISETEKREGIKLKKEELIFNPGLRSIGKLCCNSFWGRLGMRDAFPTVSLIFDLRKLNEILDDERNEVSAVRIVSENCVAVIQTCRSPDLLTFSNNTNIYLAVFTTAYARMRHFNLIGFLDSKFFYGDTDSVIAEIHPDESQNLRIGEFMGELTNELKPGEVISQFVCGGAKVYGIKTSLGRCFVKSKGFAVNANSAAAFSFENLERVVKSYFEKNLDPETGRVNLKPMSMKEKKALRQDLFTRFHESTSTKSSAGVSEDAISVYTANRIKRDLSWNLFSTIEQKIYSFQFDKKIVLSDGSCVPFGYVPDDA